jgi:hypothetical protein
MIAHTGEAPGDEPPQHRASSPMRGHVSPVPVFRTRHQSLNLAETAVRHRMRDAAASLPCGHTAQAGRHEATPPSPPGNREASLPTSSALIRTVSNLVFQAIARQARRLEPTYRALIEAVRTSRTGLPV